MHSTHSIWVCFLSFGILKIKILPVDPWTLIYADNVWLCHKTRDLGGQYVSSSAGADIASVRCNCPVCILLVRGVDGVGDSSVIGQVQLSPCSGAEPI